MNHEIIIGIHIPKTGGVTFKNILQKRYGKSLFYYINQSVSTPHAADKLCGVITNGDKIEWYGTKVIYGHFPYGLHEYIPRNIDYKYITFLRHPGDRLLSQHNYLLAGKRTEISNFMVWFGYSSHFFGANFDNSLTRNLNGTFHINNYHGVPEKVSEEDYTLALENLKSCFFVGTTETFDDDIKILSKLLNWGYIGEYTNVNVSKVKKSFLDLCDNDKNYLYETQSFDFRLWEEAKKIHSNLIK